MKKPKNTPVLFKVFPLIGSENFGFPVVINCLTFEPTKEREGIILGGLNEDLKAKNKKALLSVLDL